MLQKWERQPTRVGMLLGFVALPLLWWLRDALLRLAFGFSSDTRLYFLLLHFFAVGAIPGALLGAGLSRAAFFHLQNNFRMAKNHLISHSALDVLIGLMFITAGLRSSQNASLKIVVLGRDVPRFIGIQLGSAMGYFPLHCAILMLFVGLLMRPRR